MYLHLIAFDIPWPPTYGGVIEVYYKMQALREAGVRIILHTFLYKREPAVELEALCESVHYYQRKKPLQSLPVRYPHIVKSRAVDGLLNRLLEDDHPILFEGLHTTYFLSHPELEDRIKLVRMHNIEWEYYYQLAQREPNYLRKQYYLAESRQLQFWEDTLPFADRILTISPKDTTYYEQKFEQVTYLPAFHAHRKVSSRTGSGQFCLYHGNLSVAENVEAAMFLIKEVFAFLEYELIIAGSSPRTDLIELVQQYDHINLRPDPGESEMIELLHDAHIHVLPTYQATGIKLKLINSLFTGRWVMVNAPMITQTGLEFSTVIANEAESWIAQINQLAQQPFTDIEIAQRTATLNRNFDNARNAEKIIDLIYEVRGPAAEIGDGEPGH